MRFLENKTLLSYRIFVECFAVCSSIHTSLISLQNLIFQKTRFVFCCLPFLDMSTENWGLSRFPDFRIFDYVWKVKIRRFLLFYDCFWCYKVCYLLLSSQFQLFSKFEFDFQFSYENFDFWIENTNSNDSNISDLKTRV